MNKIIDESKYKKIKKIERRAVNFKIFKKHILKKL